MSRFRSFEVSRFQVSEFRGLEVSRFEVGSGLDLDGLAGERRAPYLFLAGDAHLDRPAQRRQHPRIGAQSHRQHARARRSTPTRCASTRPCGSRTSCRRLRTSRTSPFAPGKTTTLSGASTGSSTYCLTGPNGMTAPARTWSGMVARSTGAIDLASAVEPLFGPEIEPGSAREIEASRRRAFLDDRRDEHVAAPEELIAARNGLRIVVMVQPQRAHEREPRLGALARERIGVGQQPVAQLEVLADDRLDPRVVELARDRDPRRRRCSRAAPTGGILPRFQPHGRRRCQLRPCARNDGQNVPN